MVKLKGATLIETLAALTIIILISGMAFSLFTSVQKSARGTNELKASFLGEKYLQMNHIDDFFLEEEGFTIEKNIESKDQFEWVNVKVSKNEKILIELNKWQEKDD